VHARPYVTAPGFLSAGRKEETRLVGVNANKGCCSLENLFGKSYVLDGDRCLGPPAVLRRVIPSDRVPLIGLSLIPRDVLTRLSSMGSNLRR